MYDITDIIKKNPEEKKWYANYEAQNIIPPYIGRKQQFLTCDIVITDCVRFLQEAILLGKKVIWLEDSLLRQNPLEQKAFTNFIKTHGEIPKSDISHLPETAAKTTEAKQDIMLPEREMWKQQKDICLPELIFDKNPDSVHGILKVINFAPYDWDMRKSLPFITMKNMVKAIDIELLKIFYSFTGFFRSMGLSTGTNAKELHSYKNRHRGQRCFLIGNGPSLTIGDLELLHNEVTFGCNRLYKMFEKTNWRPTYYCMIDALIAKYSSRDLAETVECPMFTNIHTKDLMKYPPKHLVFARNLGAKHYRVSPHFESYYVPSGATVMTFMLELAMYMGFTEIYLLGVDCTSSLSSSGHCVKGYFNEEMIKKDVERIRRRLNNPSLTAEQVADYYFRQSTSSYTLIREYADKHGFHIYNATRGGMLEAFERRNLDEVVKSI